MDEQIAAIKTLTDDLERKRLRYEMLGTINTIGQTPEGRAQLAADYHIAETEYFNAKRVVRDALDRYAKLPKRPNLRIV